MNVMLLLTNWHLSDGRKFGIRNVLISKWIQSYKHMVNNCTVTETQYLIVIVSFMNICNIHSLNKMHVLTTVSYLEVKVWLRVGDCNSSQQQAMTEPLSLPLRLSPSTTDWNKSWLKLTLTELRETIETVYAHKYIYNILIYMLCTSREKYLGMTTARQMTKPSILLAESHSNGLEYSSIW